MHFKINITKAIEAAEKNLQAHIKEFAEATEVWTEKVITVLDELNGAITAQKDAVDRQGLRASDTALALTYAELQKLYRVKPVDNRANYSRYIGALKLANENEPTIEMDEYEFDQLFNDNWEWRIASKTANSMYSKG